MRRHRLYQMASHQMEQFDSTRLATRHTELFAYGHGDYWIRVFKRSPASFFTLPIIPDLNNKNKINNYFKRQQQLKLKYSYLCMSCRCNQK